MTIFNGSWDGIKSAQKRGGSLTENMHGRGVIVSGKPVQCND